MFWGLALEPGKRYSTTVEKSFHVSMASLDCSSTKNDSEILSVVLESEGSESLLCNLCKQKGILQTNLDLNFMTGDRLTFECRGHGRIHLSGYLLPDEDDDLSNMIEDEESDEEENEPSMSEILGKPKKEKRKNEAQPTGGNSAKKKKIEADAEDSDSEDDDDSDLSEGVEDEGDDDEDGEGEEEEGEDESDEEEEEEDNVPTPPKKTPNKQQQTPKTPVTNGTTPKEQKSNKKTPGGGDKNASPKQRIALKDGVIVKELRVGNGAPAKPGKMVSVSYIGRLKDGKVFDKSSKGGDFKFRLGKGEVIKGWDIGVSGMRVGGKRTITCPPEVAYGAKGASPKIPPNSTLTFEVELKNVFN